MKSSKDIFKDSLDKAFSTISLNSSTLGDHMKYKQGFTEETLEGGLSDGKTLMDLAQKHAYDDATDSTSKEKIKNMYKELKLQLDKGIKVEMEHTKSRIKAKEIAMDHLSEDPKYYEKLKKIEGKEGYQSSAKRAFSQDLQNDKDFSEFKKRARYKDDRGFEHSFGTPNVTGDDPYIKKRKWSRPGKSETKEATGSGSSGAFVGPVFGGDDAFWERSRSETPKLKESDVEKIEATEATGSGSVGGYETPAMWAKSTKKKDWGPSRKTQYKGGSFVKVKKKCTKFPYCNQGDISNLKLSKNESVKEAIKNVAKKLNIGENVIITILEHEYEKKNKRNK
jgi:hypothetical protein